ncbi:MAG: MFS transporter [Gemmatimonadaceae bacterium]
MLVRSAVPGQWRMLGILAVAELLGMSLWFAGSAIAPQLSMRWNLSVDQAGWLTTIVQLGFVVGTALAAVLNLADILPARRYFAISALLGAVANLALLSAPTFSAALLARFLTGLSLAGVYPPAMKMISTWFRLQRGLAVGTVVGALTIGKATPYLVQALPDASVTSVVAAASAGALLAALLVATCYHEGPYPFAARPFSWRLVHTVVRERRWRLATGGYLGHMWELYSFWTWIPAFLAASVAAASPADSEQASSVVPLVAFGIIAVGGVGCIWGGIAADRRGREWLVTLAMALSGSCSVLIGLFYGQSLWLLAPVALAWGFFVIADSAQFSVLVTESVPAYAVGTALTIQTSLGFLLTMFTIQLIPPVVSLVGWQWAFAVLAIGPALGISSIRRLRALI